MSETVRLPENMTVEIASIARDPAQPLGGFILQTRDDILIRRGGGDGIRIYQDLARDGHTGSVLRKRRQAVVARQWEVEAASDAPADQLAAELVRAALKRSNFDRLCQGLLGAVLNGYAVAEVMWEVAELTLEGGTRGSFVVPAGFRPRNANRFRFDREERLRLLTRENSSTGIELPERKFVLLRFWAEENEDPYGRGLGHDLFWPVYFKRNGVALWNALLEKLGLPFIYAETPAGTLDAEREKLSQALQDLARGAGLVVPAGTLIKLLEAGVGGSATGGLHEALTDAMNAEISKIVLGETLTTEIQGGGSRAASQTHDGVRQELADQDADLLSGELNEGLLRWITELNFPGAAPPTVWRRAPEEPDLLGMAELDRKLFDIGYEPTEDSVREKYGEGYRRVARASGGLPASGGTPGAMPPPPPEDDAPFAEAANPAGETVAELTERGMREAAAAQAAMVAAIQAELAAATDMADARQRLLRLAAGMPTAGLADVVEQMLQIAALSGTADVQDEAGA